MRKAGLEGIEVLTLPNVIFLSVDDNYLVFLPSSDGIETKQYYWEIIKIMQICQRGIVLHDKTIGHE